MTTIQAHNDFAKELKTLYEDREAENITDWVFENITGLKRWEIRNSPNEIEDSTAGQLKKYLYELLQHKPVQYVLNEAWFYKRKFYVNENVLIPRPETEELVEWIVSDVRSTKSNEQSNNNFKIIDIGTGSGCIPVSIKKELPDTTVTAIDVSENALKVAKKNAEELNAAIDFIQINFLIETEWDRLGPFDIMVSNPPYIPVKEKETLSKNVTDFEPGIALFVENNNPFIFYEKIVTFAGSHLKKNGKIYVEVNEEYANEIKNIFEKRGFISKLKKDMYGKERMVKSERV
ncbi:MAG: peptide chain release factor N(5)-glutamine methyltransferase [Ginsengibacter sp.]